MNAYRFLVGITLLLLAGGATQVAFAQGAQLDITPPGAAPAGSTVTVKWSGPNGPGDYITVVRRGAGPSEYLSYGPTSDGRAPVNPVALVMPAEPDGYEIRYVRGNPRSVLAAVQYEVKATAASIEGPASVAPGARFEVAWSGPNNGGDWVTIVAAGAAPRAYASYVDARSGRTDAKTGRSTATLLAPKEPGRYELRYVQQGTSVIGTRAIDVVAASASSGAVATNGVPRSLGPCALPTAMTQAFAAIKTTVTNEYAALLLTARADGSDVAALTSKRDGLLRDLDEREQQDVREAAGACAPTTAPVPTTRNTTVSMTRPGGPASNAPPTAGSPPQPMSDAPAGSPTLQTGTRSSATMRGTTIADGPVATLSAAESPTAAPPPDFTIDNEILGLARLRWPSEANRGDECAVTDPFDGSTHNYCGLPLYRVFRRAGPTAPEVELSAMPSWDPYRRWATLEDPVDDIRVTYQYRLYRKFADDTWGEATAAFTSRAPVNPTGFRASQTADTVTLTWDAAPGAVEYRIDGTGLSNTGKTVMGATTTTISPIRGEGTWQIVALYPRGNADYANRPVASNVSRPLPSHAPAWLTKSNGSGNSTETARHYAQLCNAQFRPELDQSLDAFCGSLAGVLMSWGATDENAVSGAPAVGYTNVTELASHRLTACYNSPVLGGGGAICHSETQAGVSLIIMKSEGARFAVYERIPHTPSNDDYYNGWSWGRSSFRLAPTATFDSEGPKFAPHACLACHGGRYDPATGLVVGASLLPIDPSLVIVDGDRAAAEERIRQINSIVARASPPAVDVYVTGMYGGMDDGRRRVDVAGTRAIPDYVPQGWATQRSLYLDFVKKDCAMCHLAGPAQLNFLTAGSMLSNKAAVHTAVCVARSMPHAETPFKRFWTSGSGTVSGPGWFAAALGFDSC